MEISQELVERMVNAIRAYAAADNTLIAGERSIFAELCAIAAELPVPVDPDLVEARKLVAERDNYLRIECGYRARVLDGLEDDHPAVINTLAAIKRGRELAALARSAQS